MAIALLKDVRVEPGNRLILTHRKDGKVMEKQVHEITEYKTVCYMEITE